MEHPLYSPDLKTDGVHRRSAAETIDGKQVSA
jgi:hypothetical protein